MEPAFCGDKEIDMEGYWPVALVAMQIASTLVTVTAFLVIKFNDLRHLGMSVDRIEKTVEKLDTKTDGIGERVAKLEGKVD